MSDLIADVDIRIRQSPRHQFIEHHSISVYIWLEGVWVSVLHSDHLRGLKNNSRVKQAVQMYFSTIKFWIKLLHISSELLSIRFIDEWGIELGDDYSPSTGWSHWAVRPAESHSSETLLWPAQSHRSSPSSLRAGRYLTRAQEEYHAEQRTTSISLERMH